MGRSFAAPNKAVATPTLLLSCTNIQVYCNAVESAAPSPSSFYYLLNFERALAWVGERYDDLLDATEREFAAGFARLPLASRALLVRMLMRNGPRFRSSKLDYAEIGCPLAAAAPLIALGWIERTIPQAAGGAGDHGQRRAQIVRD